SVLETLSLILISPLTITIKNSPTGILLLTSTTKFPFTNTTMSDIESDVGGRGIVFVNGNLVVDVNNNIPVGEFLMVIVSGDISINESVSNTEGVFVSDGSVIAGGESDNQLTIEGVVMAGVDAIFTRSYVDHVNNNTSPAVIFSYRPDFIFTMPSELFGGLIEWRED
ncbi:hypothetical protein KJ637_00315, partial [Patescibacteria group bacterium]|nr:hypothetical protein [Patescibacteria group bacterium]